MSCSEFIWSSVLFYDPTVGGYGDDLTVYFFSTVLQRILNCKFDTAAAGNLHARNGDASNVVVRQNCGEFS